MDSLFDDPNYIYLYEEWLNVLNFHSSSYTKERLINFFEVWCITPNGICDETQEISELTRVVNKLWINWRKNNYYDYNFNRYNIVFIEKSNIKLAWKLFKIDYEFDTENSQQMFKEMNKISNSLLNEWYLYEKMYFYFSKVTLWKSFKERFKLNFNSYNEDYFEYIINEIQEFMYEINLDFNELSRWWNHLENNGHFYFDTYSVLQRYSIIQEFKN